MRSLNGQDRPREQKPQRSNILTAGQRFTVRVALATGATFAALMGVQTLALQEQSLYAADTTSQIVTTSNDLTTEVALADSNVSTVIEATAQPTTQNTVIQATTAPVVVQATAQPTTAVITTTTSSQPQPSTRSSR